MPWHDEYLETVHDIQRGLGEQVELSTLVSAILWHAAQYFVPRKQGRQSSKLASHRPHSIRYPCTPWRAVDCHFLDRGGWSGESPRVESRALTAPSAVDRGTELRTPSPHLRAHVIVTGRGPPAHLSDMGAWAPVISVAVGP